MTSKQVIWDLFDRYYKLLADIRNLYKAAVLTQCSKSNSTWEITESKWESEFSGKSKFSSVPQNFNSFNN